MKSAQCYGDAPLDLGLIDISPTEMMAWLYCPIKVPFGELCVPDNLKQFMPIIDVVKESILWNRNYIYITAKTLFVTPENPGNRPGWHSDGFMTNDVNYIWSDSNPTLFWVPGWNNRASFTMDHIQSLKEMEDLCEPDTANHRTYPIKHLLKLDEKVIHRVNNLEKPGMRTFVKISVSEHQYRLKGNSINHGLGLDWEYVDRIEERNSPEVTANC